MEEIKEEEVCLCQDVSVYAKMNLWRKGWLLLHIVGKDKIPSIGVVWHNARVLAWRDQDVCLIFMPE